MNEQEQERKIRAKFDRVIETLKPRAGHPFFYEQTKAEEELHDRKNFDYAAGGHPLGNFTRVASILALYPGLNLSDPVVVSVVYALKQWDAALWMLSNGHSSITGEDVHTRLADVSIYAKLARCLLKDDEGGTMQDVPF